ncbi:MAG: hypothetical protein EXR79_12590 [Myxococcales bacterium]|nr:hypothetical protein [Myxococcales bacterium]
MRWRGCGGARGSALAAVKGPLPGWFGAGYTASKGAGKKDAWLVRLDAGLKVVCDDKNPCTTETCDKAKGCSYTMMKDGVECGGGLVCKVGKCVVM